MSGLFVFANLFDPHTFCKMKQSLYLFSMSEPKQNLLKLVNDGLVSLLDIGLKCCESC